MNGPPGTAIQERPAGQTDKVMPSRYRVLAVPTARGTATPWSHIVHGCHRGAQPRRCFVFIDRPLPRSCISEKEQEPWTAGAPASVAGTAVALSGVVDLTCQGAWEDSFPSRQ